jgi:hypothetical protein
LCLVVAAVGCCRFDLGGVTIGGVVRAPLSFQNTGIIPAELKIDLTKHPQFSLESAAPLDAGLAGPDDGAGGDECVLIPEDVAANDGNDDPFSPENLAAAEREEVELDEATAREQLRLYTPHKFTAKIPPGQTLYAQLVFQPTTARQHKFTLPVLLPALSVPETLHRTVIAIGLEPRVTTSLATSGNVIDFKFRVIQREAARCVPYKMQFTMKNVDSKPADWCIDPAALSGVNSVFPWSPSSGVISPGVRFFCC